MEATQDHLFPLNVELLVDVHFSDVSAKITNP